MLVSSTYSTISNQVHAEKAEIYENKGLFTFITDSETAAGYNSVIIPEPLPCKQTGSPGSGTGLLRVEEISNKTFDPIHPYHSTIPYQSPYTNAESCPHPRISGSSDEPTDNFDSEGDKRISSEHPEPQTVSKPLSKDCRDEDNESMSEPDDNTPPLSGNQEKVSIAELQPLTDQGHDQREQTEKMEEHSFLGVQSQVQFPPPLPPRKQCKTTDVIQSACSGGALRREGGTKRACWERINEIDFEHDVQQQDDYDELGDTYEGQESEEEYIVDTAGDKGATPVSERFTTPNSEASLAPRKRRKRATNRSSACIAKDNADTDSTDFSDTSTQNSASGATPKSEDIPIQGTFRMEIYEGNIAYVMRFSPSSFPATQALQREVNSSRSDGGKKQAQGPKLTPRKILTDEEEARLSGMVLRDNMPWAEIKREFPGHCLKDLKDNFFKKQRSTARKRGRKRGVRIGGL